MAGLFERRTPAGTGGNEIHNLHNIVVDGRVVAQVNRIQAASGGLNPVSHVTYLHTDLQGSTVALTNHNGEPIGDDDPSLRELFYDPFGRRIDAQNEPLDDSRRGGPRQGYTGHEHDDEYGLINMKGRIYDPEARRFLTPDPIQDASIQPKPQPLQLRPEQPSHPHRPDRVSAQPSRHRTIRDPRREQVEATDEYLFQTPSACEVTAFSKTPTATAAESTPSSDDRTSQVAIFEQSAVFKGSASEAAGAVGGFAADVVVGFVELLLGGSAANAPGPGDRTYSRQTYTEQAISVATAELGGKLLGKAFSWAKGRLFKPVAGAGAAKTVTTIGGHSLDDLSRAAGAMDRNGLTRAGRALQKHGDRPGSVFPKSAGTAAERNAQGQAVVDDILADPRGRTEGRPQQRSQRLGFNRSGCPLPNGWHVHGLVGALMSANCRLVLARDVGGT